MPDFLSENAPLSQQPPRGVFLLLPNHSAPVGVQSHYYGSPIAHSADYPRTRNISGGRTTFFIETTFD